MLVTDVEMPGMSGARPRQRLRECDPKLRVLFVTGHSTERFDLHAQQGRSEIVIEPFRRDELLAALVRLLSTP